MENANAVAPVALPLALDEQDRVQTLRGLACLLLASFHVIGGSTGGIGVDPDSLFRIFTNSFTHIRMPLFIFLSGLVYAYKPVRVGKELAFARKKLYRLLIPMAVVSTAYFVMQKFLPGANGSKMWSHMWEIYVLPYAHFWFLQAAVVIFLSAILLERLGFLKTIQSFVLILGLSFALQQADVTSWFSLNRAAFLFPYFLLGVAVHRFRNEFRSPLAISVALVAFLGLMCWQVEEAIQGDAVAKGSFLAVALSVTAVLTLVEWMPKIRLLAWIGGFSFTIYLYHVFFSAPSRSLLRAVGVNQPAILFVVGLSVAILGPILLEIALKRNKMARIVLLGQGASRASSASPTAVPALGPGPDSNAIRGHSPGVRSGGSFKSAA